MIDLEEVRQTVVAAFKTAHEVSYSATLVNYPNFVVVDLERQVEPFVSLELDIKAERSSIGEKILWVEGTLSPIFYYRDGKGYSGAVEYTDMLISSLSMKTIDNVYYDVVMPLNIITFPGWKGLMNNIKFKIVDGPC